MKQQLMHRIATYSYNNPSCTQYSQPRYQTRNYTSLTTREATRGATALLLLYVLERMFGKSVGVADGQTKCYHPQCVR